MKDEETRYKPLLTANEREYHDSSCKDSASFTEKTSLSRASTWQRFAVLTTIFISILLNVCLIAAAVTLYNRQGPANPLFPQSLYSPAQDVLAYKTEKFSSGFGDGQFGETIYQGPPSKEVDDAWEDLYIFGKSHISKEEASHLPNKTIATPEGDYLVGIAVFHQLHCLNMIRQALYSFYYPEANMTMTMKDHNHGLVGQLGLPHLTHCIDGLRQSLMCASDISPVVWQWSEKSQEVLAYAQIVHTCRDFSAVRSWAKERQYTGNIDVKQKVDMQGLCAEEDVMT